MSVRKPQPKTQKEMDALNRNIPVSECQKFKPQQKSKRTHQRLLDQVHRAVLSVIEDQKLTLFACCACENVLKQPATVKCGHTFCMGCLDGDKCPKCFVDIEEPKVDILVQTLIEKWKERNKIGDIDMPIVMLLLHPRYVLRSRHAGLQYTLDVSRNNELSEKRAKSQAIEDVFDRKHTYHRTKLRRLSNKYLGRFLKDHPKQGVTFQKVMDSMFDELEGTVEKALRKSWNCITAEELECLLCRRCLFDPVTTPCGHTFCRDCLTRVLDHRLTCPLCVSELSVGDYFRGTNKVLDEAVRVLCPNEANRNFQIYFKDFSVGRSIEVPVFVCTNAFPYVACPLYVYEPQYRLLVRRCLQNPVKMFAMLSMDPDGSKFVQYGTMLEVKDAVILEDGRIILSTQGVSRFRVISSDENDGYDTAKVELVHDVVPDRENIETLIQLHRKVHARAVHWISILTPATLSEVERLIGTMPDVEANWIDLPDGPAWTWWLIPILPLSSQLQVGFLCSTFLEKRLRAIDKMLDHMRIIRMEEDVPKADEPVTYGREDVNNEVFCSD